MPRSGSSCLFLTVEIRFSEVFVLILRDVSKSRVADANEIPQGIIRVPQGHLDH
ncbi:MAG: hypothetical protein M0T85_03055 [Dehalococcoidales bacterium]|nr:hypothetical protein [Dehalococcoidales bacterium]